MTRRLAGTAGLAFLLAGCQPGAGGPPSLRLGQEACAECRMIISDDRFAAALTTEEGESAKFDDVGCMVEHEKGGFQSTSAYWVRDFKADAWLDAREAIFVRSHSIASPMGFGLAAVSSPPAAGDFSDDPRPQTVRFDELPRVVAAEPEGDPPPATP